MGANCDKMESVDDLQILSIGIRHQDDSLDGYCHAHIQTIGAFGSRSVCVPVEAMLMSQNPARLLAERLLPEGYEDYSDGLESMIAWMLSPKKVEHLPAWAGFEDFGF
jgi:hypothetical protein